MKNKNKLALQILNNHNLTFMEWTSDWYKQYQVWYRDCMVWDNINDEEICYTIEIKEPFKLSKQMSDAIKEKIIMILLDISKNFEFEYYEDMFIYLISRVAKNNLITYNLLIFLQDMLKFLEKRKTKEIKELMSLIRGSIVLLKEDNNEI